MAITNAQQYKQLLAKGGRIGLKGGADAATVGFDKSYDLETALYLIKNKQNEPQELKKQKSQDLGKINWGQI